MSTAREDAPSHNSSDNARFREQIISVILQTLHCFKLHLTPLDIVIEILCAKGKYDEIRHAMLKPQSISRFFDALASCDTSRDLLRHNLVWDIVMKRVDSETKSIASRIGDHLQHPILLGHAEIRSEKTVAPFLRAVLNQVNKSMTSGQQASEPNQDVRDPLSEDSAMNVTGMDEAEPPEGTGLDSSTVGAFSRESTATVEATEYDNPQTPALLEGRSSTIKVEDAHFAPYHGSGAIDEYIARLVGGDDDSLPDVPSAIATEPVQLPDAAACDAQTPRSSTVQPEERGPQATATVAHSCDSSDERGPEEDRDPLPTTIPGKTPATTFPVKLFSCVTESVSSVSKISSEEDVETLQQAESTTSRDSSCEDRLLDEPAVQSAQFSTNTVRHKTCTLCSKRFKVSRSLKDHMNLHTGAKPYKCTHPGCFNKFSHYGTFAAHRRHHLEEDRVTRAVPTEVPEGTNDTSAPDRVKSGSRPPLLSALKEKSGLTNKSPADPDATSGPPRAARKRKLRVAEPTFKRKVILKLPMTEKSLESVS